MTISVVSSFTADLQRQRATFDDVNHGVSTSCYYAISNRGKLVLAYEPDFLRQPHHT